MECGTYTLAQVASKLGISETLAGEAAIRGDLPFPGFKIGRRWIFRKAEVDRWMDAREAEGPPRLRLVPRRRVSA